MGPGETEATFGSVLKQVRERRHMSQRQAAAKAELSPSFWSMLERNEGGIPTLATFWAIVDAVRPTAPETLLLLSLGGFKDALERIQSLALLSGWKHRPPIEDLVREDETLDDDAKDLLLKSIDAQRARMQLEREEIEAAWEESDRGRRARDYERELKELSLDEAEDREEYLMIRKDDPRWEPLVDLWQRMSDEMDREPTAPLFDSSIGEEQRTMYIEPKRIPGEEQTKEGKSE